MNTSKCRGCGAEVVWVKTENGRFLPVDPRAPVFAVYGTAIKAQNGYYYPCLTSKSQQGVLMLGMPDDPGDPHTEGRDVKATGRWMVSHFSTCPKADDFSKKNK